jgi:hypothetical protein
MWALYASCSALLIRSRLRRSRASGNSGAFALSEMYDVFRNENHSSSGVTAALSKFSTRSRKYSSSFASSRLNLKCLVSNKYLDGIVLKLRSFFYCSFLRWRSKLNFIQSDGKFKESALETLHNNARLNLRFDYIK